MNTHEAYVFDSVLHDGYGLRFRWNMSHTVSVFTGIDAGDDTLADLVEVDVFSVYPLHGGKPTVDEVREAVTEYLADFYRGLNET